MVGVLVCWVTLVIKPNDELCALETVQTYGAGSDWGSATRSDGEFFGDVVRLLE